MKSQSEIVRHFDNFIDYRRYAILGRRAHGCAVTGMTVRLCAAFGKSIAAAVRSAYVAAPSRPLISGPSAVYR